jgi:CRP-like cAMP-binding protein
VLCGGWAFRYLQLANGGRQILNFLLPGDLFSVASVFAQQFHYSVGALTEIQFSGFRRASVIAKYAGNLEIAKALANACMTEIKNADELVSVLGQRSAEERVAYLLLHLMKRVAAQSVIRENRYPFPLRQQHIAYAVGLTTVHVSRVMSLLRDRGIVELSNGVLQVLDLAELDRLGSVG